MSADVKSAGPGGAAGAAEAPAAVDAPPSGLRGHSIASSDLFQRGLAVIVAGQALWLAILMSRGWYYQADFSNLAGASHRPLSMSYLTTSQGGHLGLVGAVVLWLLNRLAALNYPATIVLRLLAQALATVLLARLLALLVGRRTGVLVVVGLYALSPLLVQSTLYLTSSIGFLGSQLLVLVALIAHVRYDVTRRFRWAAATAGALFGATLVSELAAVTALALPVLSLVFLADGSARARLRAMARGWPEWAIIGAPVLAYAGFLLSSGRYQRNTLGITFGQGLHVIGAEMSNALGPAIVGGPLAWNSQGGNYFAFTAAPAGVRIGAAVLVTLLVVASFRRTGWRALAAWAMPLAISAIGILVVAVGRYSQFGDFITRRLEYTALTAVPAALALCLAWWPTSPSQIRERVLGAADEQQPIATPVHTLDAPDTPKPARFWTRAAQRSRRLLPAMAVTAVVACSAASAITYTQHWSQSPAHRYVNNLSADLKAAGPGVNLFDTYVDPNVIPGIEPNRHISDLTRLMGANVQFDQGAPTPRVVGPDGHLSAASFVVTTQVIPPEDNSFCANPIRGTAERRESFATTARPTEWYLRIDYFQRYPSVIHLWLVDANGHDVAPVAGTSTVLGSTLGRRYVRFPNASAAGIRVSGGSAATSVCLTAVLLGYPFAPQQ